MNHRDEIRSALLARDQPALGRALGRCGSEAEATRLATEQLAELDVGTQAWWGAPEPSCDGTNCGYDHALVAAVVEGMMDRR